MVKNCICVQFNKQAKKREFQFISSEWIFKLEFLHSQDQKTKQKNREKKNDKEYNTYRNKNEYIVFGQ